MTYELKLDQTDVLLILRALGEMPLKSTINTFAKVQSQIAEQDEANALEVK